MNKGQLLVKLNDKELKAELQKTSYQKNLLEEKEVRQKHLLEIKAISKEEYDASLNALNMIKAQLSLLYAQIEKTELRAPFSGLIGLRNVSEGAAISPSTVITTLHNINPLKLEFSIPEKYSHELKAGTKVTFRIEGLDSVLVAEVYAFDPRIDQRSRTMLVRAMFPNNKKLVMPGSFASIKITPGEQRSSVMVPSQAIIPDASGARVFVMESGKAQFRIVQTSYRTQTQVEIVSGLSDGDTVLTSGILQLKPGMSVKAIVNQPL